MPKAHNAGPSKEAAEASLMRASGVWVQDCQHRSEYRGDQTCRSTEFRSLKEACSPVEWLARAAGTEEMRELPSTGKAGVRQAMLQLKCTERMM